MSSNKDAFLETADVLLKYEMEIHALGNKRVYGVKVKGLRDQVCSLCKRLNCIARSIEQTGASINEVTQQRLRDTIRHNRGLRTDIIKAYDLTDLIANEIRLKRPDMHQAAKELGAFLNYILYVS
ncbi:MAG: hypothetical protein WC457_02680 [Patescibacteria group bacterium]